MNTKHKFDKKQIYFSIIIKAIAIISSIYGLSMTINKLQDFTFFTTLSNVAISISLFIFMVFDTQTLISNGKINNKNNNWYIFKFMMTISITLTFLIYMFLLAPTNDGGFFYSYFRNYAGSFCVHFITPVLAIFDFIWFDYDFKSTKLHALWATIPPLVYVVFVVIMAELFGMRWYETMRAPYNFLNYGASAGWFGFDLSNINHETLGIGVFYVIVVLFLIFSGIGLLYLKIKDLRYNKINNK